MTSNTPTVFDYQGLSEGIAASVRESTDKIHRLADRTAQDIREIGAELVSVKSKIPHGRFLLWLRAEFGWSYRTAQRLMSVAEYKYDTVSHLNASASALYLLTAPSAPKSAMDEAAKRSKAGERITKAKAKEIVAGQKRIIEPPAPPIAVSNPSLPWDEQYSAQIAANPNETVFIIPERSTMWVALGQVAQFVTQKLGMYPGRLAGQESIALACITITDPQTGKEDAEKVADLEELLGKKIVTYVESDADLQAMLRMTEIRLIEPSRIAQEKRDKEAEARKPFAAPTPGMPAQRSEPQFPPEGWQRIGGSVPPVPAPVQPAMGLVIEGVGSENGNGRHEEPALDPITALPDAPAESQPEPLSIFEIPVVESEQQGLELLDQALSVALNIVRQIHDLEDEHARQVGGFLARIAQNQLAVYQTNTRKLINRSADMVRVLPEIHQSTDEFKLRNASKKVSDLRVGDDWLDRELMDLFAAVAEQRKRIQAAA